MEIAAGENDVVIDRVFDAPLELVWSAFADPKHAAQWWGPHGSTILLYEQDFRTGGTFRIHLLAPDGKICRDEGYFEEVVAPQHFTRFSTVTVEDATWFEVRIAIAFAAIGEKTRVSIRQSFYKLAPAAGDACRGAQQGWGETFDRLAAHLALGSCGGSSSKTGHSAQKGFGLRVSRHA